jgi:hypothetical protein
MRRIVTTLSALAATAMILIMTASAASAQLVAPVGDTTSDPTTQAIHHHGALVGWQIALIIVAVVVLTGVTGTLVARRVRIGTRRPVIS